MRTLTNGTGDGLAKIIEFASSNNLLNELKNTIPVVFSDISY